MPLHSKKKQAAHNSSTVMVHIEDAGTPLPSAYLNKLSFSRFFQLQSIKSHLDQIQVFGSNQVFPIEEQKFLFYFCIVSTGKFTTFVLQDDYFKKTRDSFEDDKFREEHKNEIENLANRCLVKLKENILVNEHATKINFKQLFILPLKDLQELITMMPIVKEACIIYWLIS